jgi:hypothetical protein
MIGCGAHKHPNFWRLHEASNFETDDRRRGELIPLLFKEPVQVMANLMIVLVISNKIRRLLDSLLTTPSAPLPLLENGGEWTRLATNLIPLRFEGLVLCPRRNLWDSSD